MEDGTLRFDGEVAVQYPAWLRKIRERSLCLAKLNFSTRLVNAQNPNSPRMQLLQACFEYIMHTVCAATPECADSSLVFFICAVLSIRGRSYGVNVELYGAIQR